MSHFRLASRGVLTEVFEQLRRLNPVLRPF